MLGNSSFVRTRNRVQRFSLLGGGEESERKRPWGRGCHPATEWRKSTGKEVGLRLSLPNTKKKKFETVRWKKTRIWDFKGNKFVHHLSNSQIYVVRRLWVICWRVSRNLRILYGDATLMDRSGRPIRRPVVNENIWNSLCDESAYFRSLVCFSTKLETPLSLYT